jgi:NAD-dependent DNA ligase
MNINNYTQKELIVNINKYSQEELEDILDEASYLYYNSGNVKLDDNDFDFIKEFLLQKYPNSKYKNKIGCEIKTKKKIILPFHLGSMNKIKTELSINNWKTKFKGDYCIMDKLDGCSALYEFKDNKYSLYTRGDGSEGGNISNILKYLELPKISGVKHFVVRGEIIINKHIFEKKYYGKYSNPRNFVSGIINTKNIDKNIINDIDFIAYEIVHPLMKIDEQLITLKKLKFNVVSSLIVDNFNINFLKEIFEKRKKKTNYLIDGIIIRHNSLYALPSSGNPKYAFAFKMDSEEQFGNTIVKNINWNASKYGYLKPQLVVEPVMIGGVTIKHITGKNAKFIKENKIGIGTELKIKRSGDVIPEIVEVIKNSDEPLFPENINYIWNNTNVDIIITDNSTESVDIKLITDFFKKLKTDSLSQGTIKNYIIMAIILLNKLYI